jgi:hypothetical protein
MTVAMCREQRVDLGGVWLYDRERRYPSVFEGTNTSSSRVFTQAGDFYLPHDSVRPRGWKGIGVEETDPAPRDPWEAAGLTPPGWSFLSVRKGACAIPSRQADGIDLESFIPQA